MNKDIQKSCWYCCLHSIFAVCLVAAPALADYTFELLSNNMNSVDVEPGDTFDLDIILTSDGSDVHDTAIFRVVFSSPGLSYQ